MGCNISLYSLDSHLDLFYDNLGSVSDEHGERFHQGISDMENRYQGQSSARMLDDFCLTLKRDLPEQNNNCHTLCKVKLLLCVNVNVLIFITINKGVTKMLCVGKKLFAYLKSRKKSNMIRYFYF